MYSSSRVYAYSLHDRFQNHISTFKCVYIEVTNILVAQAYRIYESSYCSRISDDLVNLYIQRIIVSSTRLTLKRWRFDLITRVGQLTCDQLLFCLSSQLSLIVYVKTHKDRSTRYWKNRHRIWQKRLCDSRLPVIQLAFWGPRLY
jgi:hypothetical protein